MRRLVVSASFLLAAAVPARSACHAVYSQGMRSMLAKQGYSVGKYAASFSSASECESALRSLKSQGQYQGDAYMQGTRCECDGGSGGGGGTGGGASFEAQVVGMAMNAFMNAFMASMKANQQRAQQEKLRAEAKRRWEELEKVRRESEKRVAELAFAASQKGALAQLSGRPGAPDGPRIPERGVPALLRGKWKEAVGQPGLTQEQRLRLRMEFPRDESGAVSLDMNAVLDRRDALRGPGAPPRWAIEGGEAALEKALEAGGEKFLEGAYGDAGRFGDALAVGRIGMQLYKGENAEAAAGAMQTLVSNIPKTGFASGTVAIVGGVTTKVFRKSWDRVLIETDKIVPGMIPEGGVEEWWQDMKRKSTTGQRGVMEYFGL